MATGRVGFRGRGYDYGLIVGVVVGLLTAGIAVPFLFGERLSSRDGATVGVRAAGSPIGTGLDGLGGPTTSSPPTTALGGGPGSGGQGPLSAAGGTATPTNGAAGGGTAPGAGTNGGSGGTTTPEEGVTADRIKLGLLYIEASGYGRGAQEFLGDSRGQFQVFVDEVNGRGGIHGRLIEPVYVPFDALDSGSARRACLSLTEDHKVFAAMVQTNFIGPATLCVTQEHQTPLVSYNIAGPREYYELSGGRWFTVMQSWTRHYEYWIAEMDRMGLLRGKTIGFLDSDYPPVKLASDTVPGLLADRGLSIAKRFTFTGEISAQQSQIPVAVQEMKAAGVDTILVTLNFLTMSQFVTQADAQLYRPQYLTNEQAGVDANAASFMPAGYDGAIGITSQRVFEDRAGLPEPAADAECRSSYEQASGQRAERGTSPYQQVLAACWLVRRFAEVATAVGPGLTRVAFVDAMQRTPSPTLPFFGGGAFAPGKFDAADLVRTVEFRANCRCFMPLDEFRRVG